MGQCAPGWGRSPPSGSPVDPGAREGIPASGTMAGSVEANSSNAAKLRTSTVLPQKEWYPSRTNRSCPSKGRADSFLKVLLDCPRKGARKGRSSMARAWPGTVAGVRLARTLSLFVPAGPRLDAAASRGRAMRLRRSGVVRRLRQRVVEATSAQEGETRDGNRGEPDGAGTRGWQWVGQLPTPEGRWAPQVFVGTETALHDFVHRRMGAPRDEGGLAAAGQQITIRLSPASGRRDRTFQVLGQLLGGMNGQGAAGQDVNMPQAAAAGAGAAPVPPPPQIPPAPRLTGPERVTPLTTEETIQVHGYLRDPELLRAVEYIAAPSRRQGMAQRMPPPEAFVMARQIETDFKRVLHGTVAALHDFVHRHLGPAQGGGNPTAGDGCAITRLSPARGRRDQTFQVLLPLPGGAGPPPAGALNTEAPMGQAAAAGGYGT